MRVIVSTHSDRDLWCLLKGTGYDEFLDKVWGFRFRTGQTLFRLRNLRALVIGIVLLYGVITEFKGQRTGQ